MPQFVESPSSASQSQPSWRWVCFEAADGQGQWMPACKVGNDWVSVGWRTSNVLELGDAIAPPIQARAQGGAEDGLASQVARLQKMVEHQAGVIEVYKELVSVIEERAPGVMASIYGDTMKAMVSQPSAPPGGPVGTVS